jgi:hypothetical protein
VPFTRRAFLIRSLRATAGAAVLGTFARPMIGLAAPAGAPKVQIQDFSDDQPPAGPFDSAPRALPAGTTHVGIHWRGEARGNATVFARTSVDGHSWSEWIQLALDDDPFGGDETFAALINTRGAGYVQYRVNLPGGRRLDRVTVTAIGADAQTSPSSTRTATTGIPSAGGPSGSFTTLDNKNRKFYSREDWGCDESLGLNGSTRIWPAMFVRTLKVVVHHTATSNTYTDGAAEVRAIYTYHAKTKGWGDIGYNSLIDRFGYIYEGRRGREGTPREYLSAGVVAGHCYHHNYGSTGVAVIGDFTKRKLNLSNTNDQNMVAALEDLVVYECGRTGMQPNGSSDFLKSDDTWHAAMPTITGHKDSEATLCPGTPLENYVTGTLRTNATNRLAPLATPTVTLSHPSNNQASSSDTLAFSWTDATNYRYRMEGWRKVNSDDIEYWSGGTSWSPSEQSGWTSGSGNGQASFSGLPSGHFTFHVQGYDASGKASSVEANFTVLVK